MEENFTNHDFEEFLQDQVRNHRMYPSDSVWRDINKKLHGDKKWPALTIAAFALLTATVTICVYFTPKPNIFSLKPATSTVLHPVQGSDNILNNLTSSARFAKQHSEPVATKKTDVQQVTKTTKQGQTIIAFAKDKLNNTLRAAGNNKAKKATSEHPKTLGALTEEKVKAEFVVSDERFLNAQVVDGDKKKGSKNPDEVTLHTIPGGSGKSAMMTDLSDKNMVDNFINEHKEDLPLYTTSKVISAKHRFGFQIYAAPSMSYRSLIEDRSIVKENTSGPVGLNNVTDVNNVVRHKPGVGLEVGASMLYNLSNTFRLKTGFQFNVRQYSIEAFRSNIELASIALIESNRIDTINTLATYRTNNGYYSDELVNRYYQLAVPIGVEWEIIGNKSIQLNVAGSIQPTYLLNRNAYLLSANFKNYTENPDIIRKWNINSNIEAFLSFKVGDFKWQVGPQVRYQPYSTFIRQYPIKEHLMDYGFKIGVSKLFN